MVPKRLKWLLSGLGVGLALVLLFLLMVAQARGYSMPARASHAIFQGNSQTFLAQNGRGDNLDAIARTTTVFISPDLENKEQFVAGDISDESGSGVMIARQVIEDRIQVFGTGLSGDIQYYIYYVLTNAHVVADENIYGVRMYDGEIYRVDDTLEYKEQFKNDPVAYNIYRFGKNISGGTEGIDLAIVKFISDKFYPVATINPVGDITSSSQVVISGWPNPDLAERGARSRFSRFGQLLSRENETNGGYSLRFNVSSLSNVSGGPVFNSGGKLIAIYGRGKGQGQDEEGFGIPVEQFVESLQNQEEYRQAFMPAAPLVSFSNTLDPLAIAQGQVNPLQSDNISEQEFNDEFGLLDVLRQDEGYQAIQSLYKQYQCMQPYPDGTSRPKVYQVRGALVKDLSECLDSISEVIFSDLSNRYVSYEELGEFQEKIESIAQEIADLQNLIDEIELPSKAGRHQIHNAKNEYGLISG